MNHDILFRGKRADDGKWIESSSIKQISSDEIFLLAGRCWVKVVPSCVGRFTGLTDKNGRKIFEGDIVICEGENCEVRFKHGTWLVEFINEEWDFLYTTSKQIESIGNIYDDPELLGGDNNA